MSPSSTHRPFLTQQEVAAIKEAYPQLLDLMAAQGFVTDEQYTAAGIPWGRFEKRIERQELAPQRHRAEILSSKFKSQLRREGRAKAAAALRTEEQAQAKQARDDVAAAAAELELGRLTLGQWKEAWWLWWAAACVCKSSVTR